MSLLPRAALHSGSEQGYPTMSMMVIGSRFGQLRQDCQERTGQVKSFLGLLDFEEKKPSAADPHKDTVQYKSTGVAFHLPPRSCWTVPLRIIFRIIQNKIG